MGGAAAARGAGTWIFKVGDDLTVDVATHLLLRQMNVLWRAAGMKCFVRSYRVYPTAERAGFIEALPNALPVREAGEFAFSRALLHSAVGAFISGFVLGLADRHQDNMLLCGPQRDCFAHIDFGYVAGQRPWFDANLLPVPERWHRACSAAQWGEFVAACGRAFAVLQAGQQELLCVARALAEPLAPVGYPAYVAEVLATHTPQSVMALVEAAPGDFNRRFKNLHHKISHGHPIEYL